MKTQITTYINKGQFNAFWVSNQKKN